MGLADIKAFYRWLEEATDKELEARKSVLETLLPTFKQAEAIEDAKKYLRHIEEEILSRSMR